MACAPGAVRGRAIGVRGLWRAGCGGQPPPGPPNLRRAPSIKNAPRRMRRRPARARTRSSRRSARAHSSAAAKARLLNRRRPGRKRPSEAADWADLGWSRLRRCGRLNVRRSRRRVRSPSAGAVTHAEGNARGVVAPCPISFGWRRRCRSKESKALRRAAAAPWFAAGCGTIRTYPVPCVG